MYRKYSFERLLAITFAELDVAAPSPGAEGAPTSTTAKVIATSLSKEYFRNKVHHPRTQTEPRQLRAI
ncbi:MAG: hypothetical protein ACTHJ6_10440, partial [Oryzihumus sp.]